MRNLIIFLAAAASALAIASPAAAQWAPQPQHHGPQHHGGGYGYGYGQNTHGQVRALQAQVDQVRRMIQRFDRANRLSHREARRLDAHASQLGRRLHHAARNGLNFRERQDIEYRVQALREAVRYSARENRRWGWNGQNSQYGHNAYGNSYGYYGERLRDDRRDRRDDDRRGDRYDDDDDDRDDDRRGRRDRD